MVIKKSITLGLFLNLGNCMVILSVHVPCPLCTGVLMILSYIFLLCPLCTGVLVIFSYYFYYFVHFIQVFWCYFYIFTLPIDVTWYPVVISGSWEQMMYLIGWDHVGLLFVQWLSYWIIDHHFIWINEGYY